MKPEEIGFPFTDTPEKIEEIIGQQLTYFSISISEVKGLEEPHVVWLHVKNNLWYRFFIDVYYLHWDEFEDTPTTHALIEEDFEEFEENGIRWRRHDLMLALQLKDEVITDAVLTYGIAGEKPYALLSFLFEKTHISLKDWGDKLPQELIIQSPTNDT